MPKRRAADARPRVFINCPFDEDYGPLLRAAAFTVAACGYLPTCALDDDDAGRIRFEKLRALITAADLAIHDLSRTELSEETHTPRFNMPFELGLYLGAKHFGGPRQRQKKCLVLAKSRREWSPTISDLAGVDPAFHHGRPDALIRAVRDFLHTSPTGGMLPGETALIADHRRFLADLPKIAAAARQTHAEALRYRNHLTFLQQFLESKPAT
ncbi:MAG TPA: hypothetical protein PLS69_08495 [Terricaulis sp.]|nr:hypothetical protein [Terricaulis sp.]HRP09608.1 hypothetical protein [Terricaulis sp.]